MNNQKYFMAVPNDIMNTKHPLHYELLNFDTNIELKIFIAILAKSTMIYKTNKKKGIQTFSIKGFLSDNSFIPRKSLNQDKLLEIINNFNNKFFNILLLKNKQIEFELSSQYIKTLKSGFTNINLMDLKKYKDIKTTKLAILTTIYPSTSKNPKPYFSLNYLFKYLAINKNLKRFEKIRQIKKAFSKLDNIEFEYKHPVNQNAEELPEHYKFHYKTPIKDIKTKENQDNNKSQKQILDEIDETFNTDDLDLDDDVNNKKVDLKKIYLNINTDNEDDLYEIPF
jgi:predicted small secreted protein